MRNIPQVLKEKLLNRFKVESTNSMAKLRVVATQTSINSLLSEPIHEDISPSFGDVAVRQMTGETSLSLAYAICIDDGIANIYRRMFPAGLDYPWEYLWTLGPASEVAIEFNGVWKMNAEKEWYYLQTEKYPYIFYVRNGKLYVQNWKDNSTSTLLASGVSEISTCKGWQSSIDQELDQGLVIGYLKGSSVYYRALCCQDNSTYVWEPEHEVTSLATGNKTLSVIRTNDFRIGFLTQNDGKMLLALTHRNYAGMSVRPETVHVNTAKVRMWISNIIESNLLNKEYASVKAALPYIFLDNPGTEEITVSSVEKMNKEEGFLCYGLKVRFSKPLYGTVDRGLAAKCTVSVPGVKISDAFYSSEEQALILLTSVDVKRTLPITISIPEYRALWYYKLGEQRWFLPSLTAFAEAESFNYRTYDNETVVVSLDPVAAWVDDAVFSCYHQAPCTVVLNISSVSMSLLPVSTLPI